MFVLDNSNLYFPPVNTANEEGLLAIGGDLSTERLLLAYRSGIFPWYSQGQPIIWWSPDPRFVLFPGELFVSKSMQKIIRQNKLRFSINTAFTGVIQNCKSISRKGQNGTWITSAIQKAYTKLHEEGYALSAETWLNNELVGGLYGVKIGNIFFGESMFSKISNASKFAFICLVRQLQKEGVLLIDCQVYTEHLESLGGVMIDRKDFIELVKLHTK